MLCVLYVCELVSGRAAEAVLERSRSRLWLNSLFGESHVPGELCFHSLAKSEFFVSSCFLPKFCLVIIFNL